MRTRHDGKNTYAIFDIAYRRVLVKSRYNAPMEREPLIVTEEDVADNMKRIGAVPENVVEMFKNREIQGAVCLAACNDILLRDPDNCTALLYKGIISVEQKEYVVAHDCLVKVTETVPLIHPAWFYRGLSELFLKETEAALDSFMRFTELSNHRAYPFCFIALSYHMQGETETALYVLDEVAKQEKFDGKEKGMILWTRGLLEEDTGDDSAALIHYIESRMMSPELNKEETAAKIYELSLKENEDYD